MRIQHKLSAIILLAVSVLFTACGGDDGKPVALKGITLRPALTIMPGRTSQLNVKFNPDNATNKSVTWTISDSKIATVSSTGLVTGIKDGQATITVTSLDGNFTASCSVLVSSKEVPAARVGLGSSSGAVNESVKGSLGNKFVR